MFSQSATGEVSSCIFSQVGHISGRGECKFSQTGPQRRRLYNARLEGEEEGDEEEEEEEEEEPDYFDSSGDEIPYM